MGNGLKVGVISFTGNGSKVTLLLYKSNLPTTDFFKPNLMICEQIKFQL
jgi:hypothetical protein